MDPNATLAEIRALTQARKNNESFDEDDLDALCDAVEVLDRWLARGGFLPTDWAR